jgi:hypothetical protein
MYSKLDVANKAAKVRVRQIWRDADDPASAKMHTDPGLSSGDRYGAAIRLDENELGSQRVWICVVEKRLRTCARVNSDSEDEETDGEEDEQSERKE